MNYRRNVRGVSWTGNMSTSCMSSTSSQKSAMQLGGVDAEEQLERPLQHELSLGKVLKSLDPEWIADNKDLFDSILATGDVCNPEQVGSIASFPSEELLVIAIPLHDFSILHSAEYQLGMEAYEVIWEATQCLLVPLRSVITSAPDNSHVRPFEPVKGLPQSWL